MLCPGMVKLLLPVSLPPPLVRPILTCYDQLKSNSNLLQSTKNDSNLLQSTKK